MTTLSCFELIYEALGDPYTAHDKIQAHIERVFSSRWERVSFDELTALNQKLFYRYGGED